jgi:hypothetical protein
MNLDAAQREVFRTCLLKLLAANGTNRFGLQCKALASLVVSYGFRPVEAEVAQEIDYLADKGLVAEIRKVLSPENRAWRITAEGRDQLAMNE